VAEFDTEPVAYRYTDSPATIRIGIGVGKRSYAAAGQPAARLATPQAAPNINAPESP
jgi:hypothetical protein